MTYQGHPIDQFMAWSLHTVASRLTGTKPLQAGFMALLLCSGGAMVLPAQAHSHQPVLTAQVPASARVVYVNPTTGNDTAGFGETEGAAYRTITYALQQVGSGTVIQLAPGSYTRQSGEVFPLVIKPGVILQGNEKTKGQTVTVIGGGAYTSPTFASQNVAIRLERDSEVRGLTITNPNTRGTGLWIEASNGLVRNSTFSNSLREGIFITGTSNPRIESNVFVQNSANGISVARAAQGEIRGNLFQNTGFGLAIGGTSSPLVVENQIIQNTDGIYVNDSARPVLRNNVIESNTRDGVVATISAQPNLGTAETPGNNLIRNNARYDVNNATRTNTVLAVGNQIQKINGLVDFVAASVEPPPGGTAPAFSDVQGHWAQAFIEALAARNIISGFPDNTYRPSDLVTRAQFAAIINRAFNPPAQRSAINFVDVASNFWGRQAIQTAYQGGFLAGYPGGVFRPEQQIPRAQVLVSLANGLGLNANTTNVLSLYQDAAQIPNYAVSPIAAATQRGLVVNYPTPGQLNPNREATRAEVAAFVYQALVNAGRAEVIPSPYLVSSP